MRFRIFHFQVFHGDAKEAAKRGECVMIPDIGIVICTYVIVRMVSFLFRSGGRKEHLAVRILAVPAILIAIIMAIDLILKGVGE